MNLFSFRVQSSKNTFDPFGSFEPSTDLFQSNEFDLFSTQQSQPKPISIPQSPPPPPLLIPQQSNNIWSSAQGKLDISLNNLIPHTRGNTQKSSLPINQLTSPTQSIFSNFNQN